jgi:hypothetical protein
MTLAMTIACQYAWGRRMVLRHTVKGNNAEDEDNGKSHDHDGVDLESGGLISVQPCAFQLAGVNSMCSRASADRGLWQLCHPARMTTSLHI